MSSLREPLKNILLTLDLKSLWSYKSKSIPKPKWIFNINSFTILKPTSQDNKSLTSNVQSFIWEPNWDNWSRRKDLRLNLILCYPLKMENRKLGTPHSGAAQIFLCSTQFISNNWIVITLDLLKPNHFWLFSSFALILLF